MSTTSKKEKGEKNMMKFRRTLVTEEFKNIRFKENIRRE